MIAALRQRLTTDLWPLVPLRLMIGFGFAAHGYAKLARGPASFATVVSALGLPAPEATAWLTVLLELGGGVLLMAGAFVAPLAVPLGIVMAVAMFGVHTRYGFSSVKLLSLGPDGARFGPTGYEIDLLYLAALVTLALAGPTPFSLDRFLRRQART